MPSTNDGHKDDPGTGGGGGTDPGGGPTPPPDPDPGGGGGGGGAPGTLGPDGVIQLFASAPGTAWYLNMNAASDPHDDRFNISYGSGSHIKSTLGGTRRNYTRWWWYQILQLCGRGTELQQWFAIF